MADSYRLGARAEQLTHDTCPAQIGRYEVVGQIGAGGMARAFLAVQREPHLASRLVAIKVLRPEAMAEGEIRDMFRTEAQVSVLLNHPNVVRTFEIGATDEFYLVMEYLEGQSLAALYRSVTRQELSILLQIYILTEVLAGLQHAHTLSDIGGTPLGLVHRDVSPTNILLTSDGEVKLLDFGIAKVAVNQTATRAGIIKGKLGYAAPEQLIGAPVDGRADIFAVGTLLWETLAGRRRVVGDTVSAVTLARLQGQESSLEEIAPTTPARLRYICARALEVEPEDRYATAAEMRQDLLAFLATLAPVSYQTQLSNLVTKTFERELAARRQAISRHIEARGAGGSGEPAQLGLEDMPSSQRLLRTPARITLGSDAPALSTGPTAHSVRDVAPFSQSPGNAPNKRRFMVRSAGAALLACGLGLGLKWGGSKQVEPNLARPSDTTSQTVAVNISISPAGATLMFDGRKVSNPFQARLARDTLPHLLEARAAGHAHQLIPISLVNDVSLGVLLQPAAQVTPPAETARIKDEFAGVAADVIPSDRDALVPASRKGRRRRDDDRNSREREAASDSSQVRAEAGQKTADGSNVVPTPAARGLRRTAEAEPGDALVGPAAARTQRNIDGADPYSN